MARLDPGTARRGPSPETRRLRLTRNVTATWWYTVSAVIFLEAMVVFTWAASLIEAGRPSPAVFTVFAGGLAWVASTVPLLLFYRHRGDEGLWARWQRLLVPLAIAALVGVVCGAVSGVWVVGVLPLVQSLLLLNWPAGLRLRMVIAATLLLGAVCFIDARSSFAADPDVNWWVPAFFSTLLPVMTVLSLWWWDVLITLDLARASEARLAATQERLRVATDVHDLQGHHLQVIALQLELAERLMANDPDAALEQLRAARGSVDEARQGTRDLATRFRSVPLVDEIANAADLLTAAGISVSTSVGEGADTAPGAVLGPIIRETTTNVLRHGGGEWARLELARDAAGWHYRIENDAVDGARDADGAGLDGIARRITDAAGNLEIIHEDGAFSLAVHLPAAERAR